MAQKVWARRTPGQIGDAYTILIVKPEGKMQLEGLMRAQEHNILKKKHTEETGCYSMDWIHMSKKRDQWQVFLSR